MRVFLPLRQQQQQQQQQQQPHSQLQSSSNLTLHPNNNCNNNTLANNSNTVTTVPEHIISSNHENKGSTTSTATATATAIGQGSDHATTLPLLEQHNEHSHTATLSPISSSTNRDKEAHIQSTTVLPTHSIPNTAESSSSSSIIDNGSSSNSTILRKRKLTFPHQTHQVLPTTKNNCNSSNPNFSELVSTTSADSKRAKLLNSNDNDSTSSKVQPSHYSLYSEPTTSLSSPSSPSFTIPTTTTTMGLYNNSNPRSDRTHRLLDYDSTTLASSSNRRRYTHTATHNHDNHDDDDPALIVNTAYRANHPNHSSSSSSFASTVPSNTFCTNTRPTKQQQHQTDVSSLFVNSLKERGLEMVEQEGDGNCLFRAVSLQVYGDSDSHMDVRKRCLDYMENDASHFSQFVEEEGESFQEYIERKRQYGQHGNNPEIQALSELFNRPVEVYVPENGGATPINIFHADYKTCDQPIRLSYHDGNHYNAVIDPLCPTAGLGLGLPGLEPGLADRLQVQKAVDESDRLHVQQVAEQSYSNELARVIQESKKLSSSMDYFNQQKALALSDFESEQEALISSIESYQMGEGSRKQPSNHHHHHHHHHHRRRQAYSQQPQQHQRSRSSSPSGSEAFASLRPRHDSPPHSSSSSHVASLPVAAPASASLLQDDEIPSHLLNQEVDDEYPQTVQELVMNGFPLPKVLKAYELIGDRFDDLLSYLMSTST
jgi:hypothetical protein